jgi:hypothetical protein
VCAAPSRHPVTPLPDRRHRQTARPSTVCLLLTACSASHSRPIRSTCGVYTHDWPRARLDCALCSPRCMRASSPASRFSTLASRRAVNKAPHELRNSHARLLPTAAANASDSRVLTQDRPLQMRLVLRCPSSRERCTPSTVHGRKSQGKLWVRVPSSWRRCLPLLRQMGGSMGWKLTRLIRGIFWHTRAASGEDVFLVL